MTNFNDTLDSKYVAKQLLKNLKFKPRCKVSESQSTNSVYITMPLTLVVEGNPVTVKLFKIRVSDHPWKHKKKDIFDKLTLYHISLRTDQGINRIFSEIDRVKNNINQLSTLAVYSEWWEKCIEVPETCLYLDFVTNFLKEMKNGSGS